MTLVRVLRPVIYPVLVISVGCGGETSAPAPPPPPSPTAVITVELTPGTVALFVGDTTRLTATAKNSVGAHLSGKAIAWASSTPAVATVSDLGLVTAVLPGSATISATSEGRTGSVQATIQGLPQGPPQSGSAQIGPAGGLVSATLANTGTVTLAVPDGAVTTQTAFRIDPSPAASPSLAAFKVTPAGVPFTKAVVLTITLPPGPQLPSLLALSYAMGSVRAIVPATFDRTSRRVVARLRQLGFPAGVASAAARLRASQSPSGVEEAGAVAEFSLDPTTLAQLVSAGTDALARMQSQESVAAAEALNDVMNTLLEVPRTPEFDALLLPVAFQWRALICSGVTTALNRYAAISTASPFDFPDYFRETIRALAWVSALKEIERPELVGRPFTSCPPGVPPYLPILKDKASQFLARIQEIVDATDLRVRFDETFEHSSGLLQRFLNLERDLSLIELEELVSDVRQLSTRLLARLRVSAYGFCRQNGQLYYTERLLAEEAGSVQQLSDYETTDLVEDLEHCGTDLLWKAKDAGGAEQGQGRLGGGEAPAAPFLTGTASLPSDGRIELTGLIRPLQCLGPNPASFEFNQEALVVYAQATGAVGEVLRRSVPPNGPRDYLQGTPLSVAAAQLRTAAGVSADQAATIKVTLVREGISCGFPLDPVRVPPSTLLGTLTLTLPEACAAAPVGWAAANLAAQVCQSLSITTLTLPNAVNSIPYSASLHATGGTGTYQWSVVSGDPPPALALGLSTGILAGTPVISGTFTFVVRVVSGGQSAQRSYTVTTSSSLIAGYDGTITGAAGCSLALVGGSTCAARLYVSYTAPLPTVCFVFWPPGQQFANCSTAGSRRFTGEFVGNTFVVSGVPGTLTGTLTGNTIQVSGPITGGSISFAGTRFTP